MKFSQKTATLLTGFLATMGSVTGVAAQNANTLPMADKPARGEYYTLFIANSYTNNLKTSPDKVFTIYRTASGHCVTGTDEFSTMSDMQHAIDMRNGTDPARVVKRIKTFSVEEIDRTGLFDRQKREAYMQAVPDCKPK